jgi:hypothetical protein
VVALAGTAAAVQFVGQRRKSSDKRRNFLGKLRFALKYFRDNEP